MKVAPSSSKRKPSNLTWEYPKGSGIKIAEMPNKTRGKVFGVSHQVRIPAKLLGRVDKREMTQVPTKQAAERLAEDRFLALKKHGTEFSKMPAPVQAQAAMAWSKLAPHGISLVEAAEAAIKFLRPEGGARTMSEVIAELLESKRGRLAAKELNQRTHDDFKSRGERIADAFPSRKIQEITHEDVAKWLRTLRTVGHPDTKKPLAQRSVKNYRNTISEVFRHAHAKRYCAENPMERFTPEELKALGGLVSEQKDGVDILTVPEAQRLLNTAVTEMNGEMLGSVVLRLFCGIRTAEVCRLDWSEVRWLVDKPHVHIPASKAKKRRVRLVDIPANALKWLALCPHPASGSVIPEKCTEKTYSNRFSHLVRLAGGGKTDKNGKWHTAWKSNSTRHSFGSYHYALHGDALKTAAQLGHKQNDEVFFTHYRDLVTEEAAKEYFSLVPATEQGKVTQFPAVSA